MRVVAISAAVLAAALLLILSAIILLLRRLRAARHAHGAATRLRLAAQDAEQTAMRRLRLAAHDLRGIGMSLHGHTDHLAASGDPLAGGIGAAASDLLDMADDLQDHTLHAGTDRVLRDEAVRLGEVVEDAVAAASASLGPGRRHWRIAPALREQILRADRRAIRHVLTRVLAEAVRSTRQDDWIDFSILRRPDAVVLVVADEGAGTASPDGLAAPPAFAPPDSRGIGLRLSLARGLMEAHGGSLEIDALTGVGTRVGLVFPAERGPVSRRSRSYAVPAPAGGGGGR